VRCVLDVFAGFAGGVLVMETIATDFEDFEKGRVGGGRTCSGLNTPLGSWLHSDSWGEGSGSCALAHECYPRTKEPMLEPSTDSSTAAGGFGSLGRPPYLSLRSQSRGEGSGSHAGV
jgi:hypothetical protein